MTRFRRLLLVPAVAVLVLAGCGDDSEEGSSETTAPPETTETTAPPETTSPPETTAAPTAEATVAVAAIDGVGDALVDAEGFTLYLFDQDDGTTSACTGGCLDVWPAAVAEGEVTPGEGVDAALLSTADGAAPNQIVYNGHLLYRFANDAAPGDANGVGIPSWFPVDAAGNAIA